MMTTKPVMCRKLTTTTTNPSQPASDRIPPASSHIHPASIPANNIARVRNPICTPTGCVNGLGMPSPMAKVITDTTNTTPRTRAVQRHIAAMILDAFICMVVEVESCATIHLLLETVSPFLVKYFRKK